MGGMNTVFIPLQEWWIRYSSLSRRMNMVYILQKNRGCWTWKYQHSQDRYHPSPEEWSWKTLVCYQVIILVTRMNQDIHPCDSCWIWSDLVLSALGPAALVPTALGQTRFSTRHSAESNALILFLMLNAYNDDDDDDDDDVNTPKVRWYRLGITPK